MFQSYKELMSLAEQGSHLPLDLTSAEMTEKSEEKPKQESTRYPAENDDNAYAAFAKLPPRPLFLWGKAVNKDLGQYFYAIRFVDFRRIFTICYVFNINLQSSERTVGERVVLHIILRKKKMRF